MVLDSGDGIRKGELRRRNKQFRVSRHLFAVFLAVLPSLLSAGGEISSRPFELSDEFATGDRYMQIRFLGTAGSSRSSPDSPGTRTTESCMPFRTTARCSTFARSSKTGA